MRKASPTKYYLKKIKKKSKPYKTLKWRLKAFAGRGGRRKEGFW